MQECMCRPMIFEFASSELEDVMRQLEPFVCEYRKNGYQYGSDESEEADYRDNILKDAKVRFDIKGGFAFLSVNEYGIRYEMAVKVKSEVKDFSYSTLFSDLLDALLRYNKHEHLIFKEVIFYGFSVSDQTSGDWLFNIRAYSTVWEKQTSKESFPVSITFEKKILIDVLKHHYLFCHDSDSSYEWDNSHIWLFIKDNVCRTMSADRVGLITRHYVDIEGEHVLTIPSGLVRKGINIFEDIIGDTIQLSYNEKYIRPLIGPSELLFKRRIDNKVKFENIIKNIGVSLLPDAYKVVLLKNSFSNALKRATSLFPYSDDEFVQLDFMPEQLKVSYKDEYHKCSMGENISADCANTFTIKALGKTLLSVLDDISTQSVTLLYPKDRYLFFFSEEETHSDVLRFVSLKIIDKESNRFYV